MSFFTKNPNKKNFLGGGGGGGGGGGTFTLVLPSTDRNRNTPQL